MNELYIPVPDKFEIEQPLQPKLTAGDYIESNGLLVPTRYADVEEAQHAAANGADVIARSEHPDEYSGPSGLGYSVRLKKNASGDYHPAYGPCASRDPYERLEAYAILKGVDPEAYVAAASLSYWRKIAGTNVTVVADNAVEGRYHIFGNPYSDELGDTGAESGALVTGNGVVERTTNGNTKQTNQFALRYKEIIDTYNTIRQLDKFNDFHCPIIELQIGAKDGQIYFLQYHRTRDEDFVDATLKPADFDASEGWVRADAVRGAYLGNRALALTLEYPVYDNGTVDLDDLDLPEDGCHGVGWGLRELDECIGRQRTAHILPIDFTSQYRDIAANHGPRSQMFKPGVTMLNDGKGRHSDMPAQLRKEAAAHAQEGALVRLEIEVAADGRNGFFRYGTELIVA